MIAPEYETLTFRLPWTVICKVACKAMVLNMDFERFAELALEQYVQQEPTE